MKKIIIYSTKYCPNCIKIKEYFIKNKISFFEKDMNTSDSLTELAINNIFTNKAPVLQIENKFYVHQQLFVESEVNENFIKSQLK